MEAVAHIVEFTGFTVESDYTLGSTINHLRTMKNYARKRIHKSGDRIARWLTSKRLRRIVLACGARAF